MKTRPVTIICSALIGLAALSSHAVAQQKTVKACEGQWRANKAENQAKGITEKAFVAQCRAGTATAQPTVPVPPAAAKSAPPVAATPKAPPAHAFPSQTGSNRGYHPHGSQPILDRSTGESSLPCRYRRVGQPEIAHLSLRQEQGLWEDKKGCVHVREGHGGSEFPCREKRKASLLMITSFLCVGIMCRLYHRSSASLVNQPLSDVNRLSFRVNQPNPL